MCTEFDKFGYLIANGPMDSIKTYSHKSLKLLFKLSGTCNEIVDNNDAEVFPFRDFVISRTDNYLQEKFEASLGYLVGARIDVKQKTYVAEDQIKNVQFLCMKKAKCF